MSRQEFKQQELSKEDIFKIIISTPKLIKYISQVDNPDFTTIIKNIKTKFEKQQKRIRKMEEDKDREQSELQEQLQQIRQRRLQYQQMVDQSDIEEQQLVEKLSKLKLNGNKENSSKGNGNTEEEKEVEEKKQNSSSEDAPRTNESQDESNPFALHQIQTGGVPQKSLLQGVVDRNTGEVEEEKKEKSSSEDTPRTNVSQVELNPLAFPQIQAGTIPQGGQSTQCTEGSNYHSSFESISQGADQCPPNFDSQSSIKSNNGSNSSANQTIIQINNNIN